MVFFFMNILRIFYYFDLYRDGTTDVTRTIHFGSPSNHEKVFTFLTYWIHQLQTCSFVLNVTMSVLPCYLFYGSRSVTLEF